MALGTDWRYLSGGVLEVRVLGRFEPTLLQSEIIEAELRPLLPTCCQRERISVRVPCGLCPAADNLVWHQDGGGPEGTTDHMVVWATEHPTHFRLSSGARVTVYPYDLVWVDNRRAWHRQPSGTDETRRWFVSVRCSGSL